MFLEISVKVFYYRKTFPTLDFPFNRGWRMWLYPLPLPTKESSREFSAVDALISQLRVVFFGAFEFKLILHRTILLENESLNVTICREHSLSVIESFAKCRRCAFCRDTTCPQYDVCTTFTRFQVLQCDCWYERVSDRPHICMFCGRTGRSAHRVV